MACIQAVSPRGRFISRPGQKRSQPASCQPARQAIKKNEPRSIKDVGSSARVRFAGTGPIRTITVFHWDLDLGKRDSHGGTEATGFACAAG